MNTQTHPAKLTIAGAPEKNGANDANGANRLLDQAMTRVPGLMERDELDLLYKLACQSPGTIVELGAAYGRSTIALCLGAQAKQVGVVTVDAFISIVQGSPTAEPALPDDVEPPTPERLHNNLAAFDLSPTIIEGLSWQAAEQVQGPVTLLFHDAEHTAAAIDQDLAAWAPKFTDDTVVVFHDYGLEIFPGVTQAADQWAAKLGLYQAENVGFLQVFRKKSAAQTSTSSARPSTEATAPSSPDRAVNPEEITIVQAYLDAFRANDLAACMEFYAGDAVLLLLTKRFRGKQEIEQWHQQRFAAKVQITDILSIQSIEKTIVLEAIVTSKRLKWWNIKLQGRAYILIEQNKIQEIDLRLVKPLK